MSGFQMQAMERLVDFLKSRDFQQAALRSYDEETFKNLRVATFVNRGIVVGVVVSTSCVGVLFVICAAVISKIYCPEQFGFVCGP